MKCMKESRLIKKPYPDLDSDKSFFKHLTSLHTFLSFGFMKHQLNPRTNIRLMKRYTP